MTRSVEVLDAEGGALWEKGGLTGWGLCTYTAGDCWMLAWELSVLLEEIAGEGALFTVGDQRHWEHVVTRVGEDLYLDAFGLQTAHEIASRWGSYLEPVPEEAAFSYGDYQGYLNSIISFDATRAQTAAVAELLLEKHCPELGLSLSA